MLHEIGVLQDSIRYYYDTDLSTLSYLYSIPHAGIYHCNREYRIQREYLDVCQMILVDEGSLHVQYRDSEQKATAGTIVLLDCREPHQYHSDSPDLKFRWFHFVGNGSRDYTCLLLNMHGFLFPAAQITQIEYDVSAIMNAVRQNQPNPFHMSTLLHHLMELLAVSFENPPKYGLEKTIQDTVNYIEQHYAETGLTVDFLSRQAALSPCYFLRKFKEYQATTPHQYIQTVRIRHAKQRLSTTSDSVEQIAEACGFSSASHFVSVFKKTVGMTPLCFRVTWK